MLKKFKEGVFVKYLIFRTKDRRRKINFVKCWQIPAEKFPGSAIVVTF